MIHLIIPLFGLIAGAGFLLLLDNMESSQALSHMKQAVAHQKVNRKLQKSLKKQRSQEDNLLINTRYYLSKRVYNRYRVLASVILLFISVLLKQYNIGVAATAAFFISAPKDYFIKMPLPWHFFCSRLRLIEQEKMDKELIESMAFLKNLIVSQNGRNMGADYIINYLAENAELTKNAYLAMLNKLRFNQIEEGEELFVQKIGSDLAKDMAHLLIQLDTIDPSGLMEAVENRQRAYREIKITKQLREDSMMSDLIYFPIIITLFIMMMNFFLIAYYIPQQDMFHSVL